MVKMWPDTDRVTWALSITILFWIAMIVWVLLVGCDIENPLPTETRDWEEVSSGAAHTCGLHKNGTVECWGCEDPYSFGQCSSPTGSFLSISSGMWHTCAITEENQIVCWGCEGTFLGETNDKGQCSPPLFSDYETVSSGFYHTSAITTEGSLDCWGCLEGDWDYGQCF